MTYPAYPEYIDSGVEWMGDIPKHWAALSLKLLAGIVLGKMLTPSGKDGMALKPYLRAKNIRWLNVDADDVNQMWFNPEEMRNLRLCKDDLLVSEGGEVGRTAIWQNEIHECYIQNSVNRVRVINGSPRFFLYQFYAAGHWGYFDAIVNRISIAHLTKEKLGDAKFLTAPIEEQTQIATFLDRETQNIDRLIEKQQQLIKLLQEKRQAVISHAVTKGLNPNAEMKDSSVEWLGEIPAHWGMVPLKYLCDFSGGGTPSKDNLSYWVGGDVPWVSPKDMKSFWISDTRDKLTAIAVVESSTNFVERGALLMVVRSGILQRTIPIAINTVKVTLNQDMKALKFNGRMSVEYAANYILGNVSPLLLAWSKEGATVESIEQEYLAASLFPVPPIDEQNAINNYLKTKVDAFQKLIDRAGDGITLLSERRTALISAAVTGKIDIRNVANG